MQYSAKKVWAVSGESSSQSHLTKETHPPPSQSPKNGCALRSLSCQGIGWGDFRAQLSAGDLRHASSGHHSCPKTHSGGMGWRSKIWRCLIFQMKKYIDDSPSLTIGFIHSIPTIISFLLSKNLQFFLLVFTYVIL